MLTTVREPVGRIISEYRHVCAGGAWDFGARCTSDCKQYALTAKGKEKNGDSKKCESEEAIRDFVSVQAHANGMRNRQAQFLAGVTAHPCAKRPSCDLRDRPSGRESGRDDHSLDALLLNETALHMPAEALSERHWPSLCVLLENS